MTSGSGGATPGEPFHPAGVAWTPVSRRLATSRRVSLLLSTLPFVIGCSVAAWLLEWPQLLLPAVGLLLALAWGWWAVGRQVRAWGYAEREDDLLVRRGVLWRGVVVVPYGRMQYVDVEQGPLDRMFHIASVQLHTASAATDARIPGLAPAEAARLRDRLASRGQAQLAGL